MYAGGRRLGHDLDLAVDDQLVVVLRARRLSAAAEKHGRREWPRFCRSCSPPDYVAVPGCSARDGPRVQPIVIDLLSS